MKLRWKFFWAFFAVSAASFLSFQLLELVLPGNGTPPTGSTLLFRLALPLGVALGLSLVFARLFSGQIASHIVKMIISARGLSPRTYPATQKSEGGNELEMFSKQFELLANELSSQLRLLNSQKLQLDSLLSNLKEGVLALNSRGEIISANQPAREIFNLGENWLNTSYSLHIRHPALNQMLAGVLATKQGQSIETNLGFPEERVLLAEGVALQAAEPEQAAAILVLFDITELKRLERVRKDFVANASHELRTPLTSIRGFVEALQDGAIAKPQEAQEFLTIISRQIERMSKILADMLLLSEIESEGYQLKVESSSLNNLIIEIVPQFKNLNESRKIKVETKLSPEVAKVSADRDKISQVFINLLDNAIKFTPEGGRVTVSTAKGSGEVTVSIQDTGPGIPSTDLPRIFERFYRVEKSRTREAGGTGLGLAIVKHIVEAHGGKVWVESELNRGSTFHFSLPV